MATKAGEWRESRWRMIVRAAATLLLVLAVVDLTFPQLCGEDMEPIGQGSSASAAAARTDDREERRPAPTEDCFCCCSHIDCPDPAMPLGAMSLVSESPAGLPDTVTVAPGPYLFRPPRLA